MIQRPPAPTQRTLPSLRVLLCFPLLVLVVFLLLVGLGWTGSSTAWWWSLTGHRGRDPALVVGRPRLIRVDEWQVQASWIVSQYAQHFPRINTVMPGGMDASVMNDLPTWDWSTLFRPHLWGFLVMRLDRGMAWRWWMPSALMLVSIYSFTVSILPRRALLGALLALTVLFQPTVQWLWLPIVPEPVTFAFATMTAVVWGARSTSRLGRWLPAAFAAYAAVDMAMTIYVPFIVPALLTVVAFALGFALRELRSGDRGWSEVLRGLVPLAVAGCGSALVLGAWVLTRRAAVTALLSTVYPGQRSTPPGTGTKADLISWLSAPFQRALQQDQWAGLGPQQTDAASPLMIGVFLVVPMVAVAVLIWRREKHVDWLIVAIIASQLLAFAWVFVPGWGPLAKVLLLDRTLVTRMRLLLLIQGVVTVVLLTDRLERLRLSVAWYAAAIPAGLALLASGWVWHELSAQHSPVVPSWSAVLVTLGLAGSLLLISLRRATAAAGVLLACSLVIGAGVNPIYHGLFDLRKDSAVGAFVVKTGRQHPQARWVGIGDVSEFVLVEAGVHAYNGVQTYPSSLMWNQIDPDGTSDGISNRLAGVTWVPGVGGPQPHLLSPQAPDQIRLDFDSCASFAQRYVDYVLVDAQPLDQSCVRKVKTIKQQLGRFRIYRVIRPPHRQ